MPGCSHPNSDAIYGGGTELQDVTLEQCQRRCREVQDCVGGTYFNAWEWNLVRCYIKETYLPDAPDKKFTAFRAFCGCKLSKSNTETSVNKPNSFLGLLSCCWSYYPGEFYVILLNEPNYRWTSARRMAPIQTQRIPRRNQCWNLISGSPSRLPSARGLFIGIWQRKRTQFHRTLHEKRIRRTS